MCGRFTLTVDPGELKQAFPDFTIPEGFVPRFNIAPTQSVAVIPNTGEKIIDFYLWGLIPSWSKDPDIGSKMINARAETLSEKPSFRTAFKRRRCLILADGFYEWQQSPEGKSKTPIYIRLKTNKPFGFAGLWEVWNSPDGSQLRSCAIITTQPNELMAPIHNRMPVILPPDVYHIWLDPGEKHSDEISPLLAPFDSNLMTAYPVSRRVNDPKVDHPSLIQKA